MLPKSGPGAGDPSECPFCDGGRIWFDGWRWELNEAAARQLE